MPVPIRIARWSHRLRVRVTKGVGKMVEVEST